MSDHRTLIIKAGIRNLKEFGYEHVTEENILTDLVYSQFFKSMLDDNMGHGYDKVLTALKDEIAAAAKE